MKYLLVLILMLSTSICSSKETGVPVHSGFNILDSLEAEKPIRIQWITHKAQSTPASILTVTADVAGGLLYDGAMSWLIDLVAQPVCTTEFTVVIPPKDTCVIAFNGHVALPSKAGLTEISGAITFLWNEKGQLESVGTDYRTWSDEDKIYMKYGGALYGDAERGIPARYPDPPGIGEPRPMPPDSMGTSSSEYVSPLDQEITLKKMKERDACIVDTEYQRVADTLFHRFKGDYEFKKIIPNYKATLEEKQWLQNYMTNVDTTYHDLMLDLRDEGKYRAAVEILGDTALKATDCPGIYFARMLGKTWKRFGGNIKGVQPAAPCEKWIEFLDRVRDTTRVTPPKKSEEKVRPRQSSDGSADIFYDGLEGYWNWYSDDENFGSGFDSWRDVNVRARTGSWSAWCAADGDVPIGVYYDNDMYATMSSIDPISLAGYTNTRISFWAWYETQPLADHFQLWASANGITWQELTYGYSGSSFGEWENIDIGFVSTSGNVYLRFLFYSNAAGLGEGVYIDDIRVYGTAKPNLVPYTPAFWSDDIVVSATMPGNTNSTVYGGEPSYIDFAIKNIGQAATTTNPSATLYIDGTAITTWTKSSPLLKDSIWKVEDYVRTLATGWREISIRADNSNSIAEENETDNIATVSVYYNPPTLAISGVATFWNMNPPASGNKKAQGVRVELRDSEGSGVSELLAVDYTDDYGGYNFTGINNVDANGGQQDIFLRVLAENHATRVQDYRNSPTINYDTPVENNLLSGSYTLNTQIDQSHSGGFFIAQTVLESKLRWLQVRPSNDPGLVVCANISGDTTGYNREHDRIYISKSNNSSQFFPDTYDRPVIEHEYGHVLTTRLHFLDSSLGGDHFFGDTVSKHLASDEAFATYFSCWNRNRSIYYDKRNNFTDSLVRNLENGEHGTNQFTGSANNYGTVCEGAVAGILWDIYDQGTPTNDDYTRWNGVSGQGVQDGIGDSLSYASGMANILTSLLDRTVNGHKPDDMDEFWKSWFQAPSNAHLRAVRDIYYEHGDTITCCAGIRGNVDYDNNDAVNIVDVNALSAYLFEGAILKCKTEANLDAVSIVNVVDLTYLIAYLFRGGPPPVGCP